MPGYEEDFFVTLLEHIRHSGLKALNLSPLLSESTVITKLKPIAASRGLEMVCEQEEVTVYLDLPAELTQYHALLSGKQRHEILRKERRLKEEGELKFTNYPVPGNDYVEIFMNFFRDSRDDKREFLTADRQNFFQSIFKGAALNDMLKLGILELNSQPIAATLCFDYRNEVYLYNSGYNPSYRWLSAGLLSKYYCIKDSIEKGKARFDFLKGAEQYKYHLGGKDQPIYRCIIKF
jgi:CelD/BcsL family acetyltransferase involved in cellulose biosynthesis